MTRRHRRAVSTHVHAAIDGGCAVRVEAYASATERPCRVPLPQAAAGMIERAEMSSIRRVVMVGDRWLDRVRQAAGTASVRRPRRPRGTRRGARRCYPQQSDGGRWLDSAHLLSLTGAFRGRRVVVVGDVVADEFVYGRVARVSREAPVLILEYDSTEIVPGGAGNAANNVAALGGSAALVAVVGRDEPARRVVAALHRRVDPRHLRGRRARRRRSRRASWPAASIRPSSRWCGSIAPWRSDGRQARAGIRARSARGHRARMRCCCPTTDRAW